MDPKVLSFIHGVLVPGAAAGLVALALARPWRAAQPWTARAAGALAVAAAVAAASIVSKGWPGLWPSDRARLVLHLVALAALLAMLRAAWARPVWLRACLVLALSGGVAYLMTGHRWGAAWTTTQTIAWGASLTAVGGLTWLILEMLADRARGFWLPVLLWMTATGLSLGLVLAAGEAFLSIVAASVAAAAAVIALVGWWRPGWALAGPVVAPATVGLLAMAFFAVSKSMDGLPIPAASLLAVAAPGGGLLREFLASRGLKPWLATALGLALGVILVAAAVALASRHYVPLEDYT